MRLLSSLITLSLLVANSLAISIPSAHRARAPTSNPKYVFAHFMLGNAYPYNPALWKSDFQLAKDNGIDAFALNMGSDSWQPARIADAYAAAQSLGFKLFFSFDMTVLPCGGSGDGSNLVNLVNQYKSHPAQFVYPPGSGKAFVSTFSGETCQFGQGSTANGWKNTFKNPLGSSITFCPSFFGDPATWGGNGILDVIDCDFNWNSAWPWAQTSDSMGSMLGGMGENINNAVFAPMGSPAYKSLTAILGSFDFDAQHYNAIGPNKYYMAAASPWFYTHYGADSWNKNWVYASDALYPNRWEAIVANQSHVDLVEAISWNDYGESHYIGPIDGAQPNSQAWVNGMDHTPWLAMTKYFSAAFKNDGVYPAIAQDQIYLWGRPHPKNANAPDPVGKPTGYQMMQDSLFAVVMATAPAAVTLATSNDGSGGQVFKVEAGFTQINIPLSVGGTMYGSLSRNGQTVITVSNTNFTFVANPPTYNYNAFVAMATTSYPEN